MSAGALRFGGHTGTGLNTRDACVRHDGTGGGAAVQ